MVVVHIAILPAHILHREVQHPHRGHCHGRTERPLRFLRRRCASRIHWRTQLLERRKLFVFSSLSAESNMYQGYTRSNKVLNSSADTEQNCRQAQATTAFLWFGWAAFVATLAVNIMNGRGSGANLRGGIRRGGPSMSQV